MEEKYRVTGLMSGSSMDGCDLACCDLIWNGSQWSYHILKADTLPYDPAWKSRLEEACQWSMGKIRALDLELGEYYASLLNEFHHRHGLSPDFIASHGHTILHEPGRGLTYQAGNGAIMAKRTGITVVNDFRSEDVAQGGQGAPLVPIGDRLFFSQYEGCLNLGGFANISCEGEEGKRLAYDLSTANMALNHVAGMKGLEYDEDGAMARRGACQPDLLEKLNQLDFYGQSPPKSLGREWFLEYMLPLMVESNLSSEDLMATVLEHIAIQVARGVNDANISTLLITGGGALNSALVEAIDKFTRAEISIPDRILIDYKEALVFALLGTLKIRGEINCLSSVTGGKSDLSAGTIHNV